MTAPATHEELMALCLDQASFVSLLEKLVAEVPHLMNRPPELIPQESRAAAHVLERLAPHVASGVLKVREICYHEGRSNVIIEYPAAVGTGAAPASCAFVGSHLDVVYADPASWEFDPFHLTVDGDLLKGRGTTDCLGHVALLTELFCQLATLKPELNVTVWGVLIADEEAGDEEDVGVAGLMKQGELERLNEGPVFWLDCADKQPNIGSGGTVQWSLVASGRNFHSGFPHKACNAIELAADALKYMQKRFYTDFPPHPKEKEYGFPCTSSLKATNVIVPDGSLNQIRGLCTIQGDVRLVPFYKIADVRTAMEKYVRDLNKEKFASLDPTGGYPYHSDEVPDAKLELKWHGAGMDGIACDLNSRGYKFLAEATELHVGTCSPLADTGSLPLVAELQAHGWDVQTVGYGVEDAYHADNEFARLNDFAEGFKVLMHIIVKLSESNQA